MPARIDRLELIRRFWLRVDKLGPIPSHRPELGNCWIWTGYRKPNGYGSLPVERVTTYAHRFSYSLVHGEPEYNVLHDCDNPPCVRPSHLTDGTQAANLEDARIKGRMPSVPKREKTGPRRGSDNPMAKLTPDRVAAIRRDYRPRVVTCAALAKRENVSPMTISLIVRGLLWPDVPVAS